MRIHFIRHATLVVEAGARRVLVDPMLGRQGSLPPYAFFRHRPRRNPLVPLPSGVETLLETVTAGIVTHCRRGHLDHLDRDGAELLARRGVPVYGSENDEAYLRKKGLEAVALGHGRREEFQGGRITSVAAAHGTGVVGALMGAGAGYLVELPGEPSLYISGDTVLTPEVRRVLNEMKPAVAVLNAGGASLDVGSPILMPMAEMLEFIRLAPGIVIAAHMEALNHCPVSRSLFREAVGEAGLARKVLVPEDGEVLAL